MATTLTPMPVVQDTGRLPADGRPAEGDRAAREKPRGRRALPDAARRDRHREDRDDGPDHREDRPPGARDRAQQDAGGAALQRVRRVLPDERGRVLRLVLRLLPARGYIPQADLYIEKDSSRRRSTSSRLRRPRRRRCSPDATWSSSPRCRASTASARRRSGASACSSPTSRMSTRSRHSSGEPRP